MVLEDKHFTALPAGSNAAFISFQFRQLLVQNLIGYLNSIQSSLGLDIDFIIKKYEKINIAKNFSPAIYTLFSRLVKCCLAGDVPPIIDVVHQLSILSEQDIFDSNFRTSTILTETWETDFINKIRNEPIPNKNDEKTIVLPIINPNLSEFTTVVGNVFEQVKKLDFEFYQEIESYVTRLKLFNGKGITASTTSSAFGAIYLNMPKNGEDKLVYFAEHIIHETSHLNLEILFAFDKIVLNKETEKFKSPLRIDPRPMLGIFHATFVLSRMVRLFQRIDKYFPKKEYAEKIQIFRKQFNEGLEVVDKYALLTEKGLLIKSSFIETAEF